MLVAKNISKKFSGIAALSNVNLELHPGKVNAIIGGNGAGKSTLMKIFSGVHTQYEGQIIYNGQPVQFSGTREAEQAGIAIIHQELNLVPYLSVAENIFLGREITNPWGVLDKRQMREITRQLLVRLNLSVHPDTKIATLKVGQQQLIEIAKALYSNASVLIMDEPTSAISDKEVSNLFSIIDQLRTDGKIIVYISHKLKELFAIADRYVVLRDGCSIESGRMHDVSEDVLIQKMTGRNIDPGRREVVRRNEKILEVKNISLRHAFVPGRKVLKNISFHLHKGEVLGLYGLMGAGRTELLETLFGMHAADSSGEMHVDGRLTGVRSPAGAIRAGIALVPEDRKRHGLVLHQPVRWNISITILDKLQRLGMVTSRSLEKNVADHYIGKLAIKTGSGGNSLAQELSGGNQQKIVLAKWLATHPKILLLDEPTRGVDVNAKAEIYKLMRSLAADGLSIIMASSEMPEILAVSDRVLVLCEGALSAEMPVEDATETELLKHAIGKQ